MAIIKCMNGHYFDDSKFQTCPHCERAGGANNSAASQSNKVEGLENHTVAMKQSGGSILTKSLRDTLGESEDQNKTVGFFLNGKNLNPVSGWLVCVDGENRGRSFEIHIGKNFVGRSMKMDIHTNDEQISRENHFSIIYDPKSGIFFVLQGNGITYVNDKLLSDGVELNEGDRIEAGQSKYVFVPFCKEGRDWND